jgi:hypothetical protein
MNRVIPQTIERQKHRSGSSYWDMGVAKLEGVYSSKALCESAARVWCLARTGTGLAFTRCSPLNAHIIARVHMQLWNACNVN